MYTHIYIHYIHEGTDEFIDNRTIYHTLHKNLQRKLIAILCITLSPPAKKLMLIMNNAIFFQLLRCWALRSMTNPVISGPWGSSCTFCKYFF